MRIPSLHRQQMLRRDLPHVQAVRAAAMIRFGENALARDPSLLWTMRCMWGMDGRLPFKATVSKTLSEWLWIARQEQEGV